MRTDTGNFIAKNQARSKTPHYTIEVAFDSDFTDVYYFTSHSDAKTPSGATVISGVVSNISGTSQKVSPEKAISSIGSISFKLVDKNNDVRDLIYEQNALGRSLKTKRVRVYCGFEGLAWDDYSLVETQIIEEIQYHDGYYTILCSDIQREARQDIFVLNETSLTQTIDEDDLLIPVSSVDDFEFFARGSAYTDSAPSPDVPVLYIKIDDEVIRCVGTDTDATLGTVFVADERGALNTKAVEHTVDNTVSTANRKAVTEFVYIEMPAIKLMYALLTGNLLNSGSPLLTIPSNWHLGIDTSYVSEDDFNNVGLDIYNPNDDTDGLIVRLEGAEKQDGKKFIEQELAYLIGGYLPIYSDGSMGFKRIPRITANASYIRLLDESNIVSYSSIKHSMKDVLNVLDIEWNYDHITKTYTRLSRQIDSDSVAIYKASPPKTVQFRGLHGNRHTDEVLAGRFEAIRDRYSGPPIYLTLNLLPSCNDLEVGDIVRVALPQIHDFETGASLDRSFEIQQVSKDWITGNVSVTLFGSVRTATPIAPTIGATVIADAFYSSEGTELTAALDAQSPQGAYSLTGDVLHLTSDSALTGNADLTNTAAIYYYLGDLTIDSGVTITITQNVQLRVMGFLTINGAIDGAGNGISGGGSGGFIGATESGGGVNLEYRSVFNNYQLFVISSVRGSSQQGTFLQVPYINFESDGSTLTGMPTDLRGAPGLAGGSLVSSPLGGTYAGGAGGAGGSGLAIISRGASFGAAGSIDVSGADGLQPSSQSFGIGVSASAPVVFFPGTGGGGAPGAVYFLMDGSSAVTPLLSKVITLQGNSAARGNPLPTAGEYQDSYLNTSQPNHSYYAGFSAVDKDTKRIQFLPGAGTVEQDPDFGIISAPTSLMISSGTNQLIREADGTIIVRALLSWTASTDQRVVGYETQYKLNSESTWYTGPTVIDGTEIYLLGLQSGANYDFRVRAADGFNHSSAWLTASGVTVLGKSEPPPDCDTFLVNRMSDGTRQFSGGLMAANVPPDFAGYRIRYGLGTGLTWDNLSPLHQGNLTALPWETNQLAAGTYTFGIKAIDTTGNLSDTALYIETTLGDPRLRSSLYVADPLDEGFPGTLTQCFVDSDGVLRADSSYTWDTLGGSPTWSWDDWQFWHDGFYTSFVYQYDTIDVGVVTAFTPLISVTSNASTVTIEERHSDGDTSPWTWSSWAATGSQITARYIQIRVTVETTSSPLAWLEISQMFINLDAEPVIEYIEDLDTSTIGSPVAAGELRLPITETFNVIRIVNLTLQNVGPGWTWEVIDKNVTLGPRVKIYNGSGTLADATIDAEIIGI